VPSPWSQRIEVDWSPALRFYENRIGILRELQDKGILKAFRTRDHAVDGRLFDGDHVLTVRHNGVSLQLLRPEADVMAGWDAVSLAFSRIHPSGPTHVYVALQYVMELEGDYRNMVGKGRERLLSVPLTDDIEASDWALLLDLELEAQPGSVGQVEFGITANVELPHRLARLVGKLSGERADIDPDHWTVEEFPAVSLFADSGAACCRSA
jgi:hypothetical protein